MHRKKQHKEMKWAIVTVSARRDREMMQKKKKKKLSSIKYMKHYSRVQQLPNPKNSIPAGSSAR